MSKIRGKNTKPELLLRSELFKKGYRFRINQKNLPGKPDIVLKKYNTVIFVNGCFWHYHKKCNEGRIPSSNVNYWKPKLEKTVIKDKENLIALRKQNWKVVVVWECEIEKKLNSVLIKVLKKINA